jgi:heat shock protein HslJ
MKEPWRLGLGLLACVLLAIACGKKEASQDAPPPPGDSPAAIVRPTDIDWILVRLGDETVKQNGLKQMQLRLASMDKEAQGQSTCNTFRSRYELDEAGLRFGPLAVTRMACPKLDIEKRYLDAIQATSRWSFEGDRLILSDASGKPVAEFARRTTD